MKIKQKLKPFIPICAWGTVLAFSISCKNAEPLSGCDLDASCCVPSPEEAKIDGYTLLAKFENEPADLYELNNGLFFQNGFAVEGQKPYLKQQSIPLCSHPENRAKAANLLPTVVFNNTNFYEDTPFAYRVWGKIFWLKNATGITGLPFLRCQIDRIEKIK